MLDDRLMTYAELAEFLGRSEEAARQLAKRRRWRRSISNEDGKARVAVPVEFLEAPRPPVDPRSDDEADADQPGDDRADDALGLVVNMLRERVDSLTAELATARSDLELERVRAGQAEVLKALIAVEQTRVEELRADCRRWEERADEALKALIARTAVEPRPTPQPAAPARSWWPWRRSA